MTPELVQNSLPWTGLPLGTSASAGATTGSTGSFRVFGRSRLRTATALAPVRSVLGQGTLMEGLVDIFGGRLWVTRLATRRRAGLRVMNEIHPFTLTSFWARVATSGSAAFSLHRTRLHFSFPGGVMERPGAFSILHQRATLPSRHRQTHLAPRQRPQVCRIAGKPRRH